MPKQGRRAQVGVSMVEQLLTGLIAGLLVLMALPGLMEAKDKRRIDGLVAALETEMQFARGEAVARNETVRVGFRTDAGGSCYVMHTGQPGQCTCQSDGRAQCVGQGQVLRTAIQRAGDGIRVSSSATEIGFDASRGTATPTTTLRLENQRGDRVNLVVNVMGRLRTCSANAGYTGYAAC